jgi:hypothetical protein
LTVVNTVYLSYILNRGWVDKDSKKVPTYKDIVGPSKSKKKPKTIKDVEAEASSASEVEADEEEEQGADHARFDEDDFDEINEQFETSYNFRFEEPYVHFTLVNLTALTSFPGTARISRAIRVLLARQSAAQTQREKRLGPARKSELRRS